jgi:hypothetical protein
LQRGWRVTAAAGRVIPRSNGQCRENALQHVSLFRTSTGDRPGAGGVGLPPAPEVLGERTPKYAGNSLRGDSRGGVLHTFSRFAGPPRQGRNDPPAGREPAASNRSQLSSAGATGAPKGDNGTPAAPPGAPRDLRPGVRFLGPCT